MKNLSRHFKAYQKQEGFLGSVKSLFKRDYREVKAVDEISFSIEKGEKVGFIGPNGDGKTTTLKMLSGLLHPSQGDIQVLDHKPYLRENEYKKKISIVLGQKSQLWWDLPAIESMLLNKKLYDIPEKKFRQDLKRIAELLEIENILNVQVRKLSLGQRMKCELLAAIIHRPQVIFLDEPTIGLDVVMQKRIRDFFAHHNKQYHTTIILTRHYMDDVKELCDRLIIIDHGQIIYDGSLNQLLKKYAVNKYLTMVFYRKVELEELKKFGKIIDHEDYQVTLSVPRSEHIKIATEIMQKYGVDDLDIQEQKLEDVIRKIFTKNEHTK